MVKGIISEHMAGSGLAIVKTSTTDTVELHDESNIDIMLKNLEMFTT